MFENIKEYKGLKVVRESMWSSKYNSARYKDSVITLYDYFYTFTPNKQKAVLEHEFAHHIFNTFPQDIKKLWINHSRKNTEYINSHAEKNYFEDFGECIEAYNLIKSWDLPKQTGMLNLKIEIAVFLYTEYMYKEISNLMTEKYNNKAVDYDWVYWHQCVDLAKQYSAEYLLQPLGTFWGSAKTGWENKSNTFPEDTWKKIPYTGENKPETGDIVFYDMLPYWHVGVCVGDNWVIFEQNAVTWTWEWEVNNCRIEIMKKDNLAGWYRLKY